jgi:preprotein translocase subunit YajC
VNWELVLQLIPIVLIFLMFGCQYFLVRCLRKSHAREKSLINALEKAAYLIKLLNEERRP